jgi:hypothetical protein
VSLFADSDIELAAVLDTTPHTGVGLGASISGVLYDLPAAE